MKKLWVNPTTRLICTSPECARTSVSSHKLQMQEFGKDNLKDIAREVFPR